MRNKLTEFEGRHEGFLGDDDEQPCIICTKPDLEQLIRSIYDEIETWATWGCEHNPTTDYSTVRTEHIRSVFSEYINLDNNGDNGTTRA